MSCAMAVKVDVLVAVGVFLVGIGIKSQESPKGIFRNFG